MPLIVRAAGKRFAAPRPKPSTDNYARQRYFDDLEVCLSQIENSYKFGVSNIILIWLHVQQ